MNKVIHTTLVEGKLTRAYPQRPYWLTLLLQRLGA